jgi:hypothetical protein
MLSGVVPVLESWMFIVALDPTGWLNVRLGGLSVASGLMPVPDRLTICGLPDASSDTDTFALLVPIVVGANRTPRKQELPALRVLAVWGHIGEPLVGVTSANWAESVPVREIAVMFNVAVPELASCRLVVALWVPINWLLKGVLPGFSVTAGAG